MEGFEDLKPAKITGRKVKVKNKKALNTALRLFKKVIKDSGVLIEYKNRQEYKKPTTLRKEAKNRAMIKYEKIKEEHWEDLGIIPKKRRKK